MKLLVPKKKRNRIALTAAYMPKEICNKQVWENALVYIEYYIFISQTTQVR